MKLWIVEIILCLINLFLVGLWATQGGHPVLVILYSIAAVCWAIAATLGFVTEQL